MLYEGYEFKKQKVEIKQEILDEERKLNQQYDEVPNNDDIDDNMDVSFTIPDAEEKKETNKKQSDEFDQVLNDGELIHLKRKKISAS